MNDVAGTATFRTPAEANDHHVGRCGGELARALRAAVGVRQGRALDVGCGPGALTTELVALLGAERIAAVDPSAPFADACQASASRWQPPRSCRSTTLRSTTRSPSSS